MWPPVVFTPKATSRRGPVPPPSVPGPVCHSTCRGVFAEPLGAGFPKPRRNAPASTGKPVRRAGRLGECPAGIGRYRGSLAVSSCPHCWPGLLDRPQARRHSLQVGKTVTSRDCGATVATERSGGGGVRPGHLPAAWPVPTRVLQPSPPSLTAARVVAWPCLDRLSTHQTAGAATCSGSRECPTRPRQTWATARPALSLPCPLPRRPPVAAVVARHSR